MSYQTSAEIINQELKQIFKSIKTENIHPETKEKLLNTIISIGQIAKFRCRNNTAYDNFITLCYKDIAQVNRTQTKYNTFPKLQVI